MLERLKLSVDKGKAFGVLLTDLSKAFHYLSNELIQDSVFLYKLKLIQTCLTERKYGTKINQVQSSWKEILFGVSPMIYTSSDFFNIFLSNLFLAVQYIDFSSYPHGDTIKQVTVQLRSYFPSKNHLENLLSGLLIIN